MAHPASLFVHPQWKICTKKTIFINNQKWCATHLCTYLNFFGASNIRTTVLPMLNWPSNSPFDSFVSAGNRYSSNSLTWLCLPILNPVHRFVFSCLSMYTSTEPTFVAPKNTTKRKQFKHILYKNFQKNWFINLKNINVLAIILKYLK